MGTVRRIIYDRIWLAALVVAATLSIRLIVPAGFMPVFAGGTVSIEPCSGHGVEAMAAMPGMAHGHHDPHGTTPDDQPCGFSGHAPAAMAGVDPVLLVLAIAFIVATVFRSPPARPTPRRDFLRPHLRGPPAIA